MDNKDNKKVLLSVKDLEVKFRVRGRILTAIRRVSLDIYENESIAIVGESGSGKSVFTKTFAGMLDSNGFISNGSIIFDDEDLAKTKAAKSRMALSTVKNCAKRLNGYSKLEVASDVYRRMLELEAEKKRRGCLTDEETADFDAKVKELEFKKTELHNAKLTLDPGKEKARIKEISAQIDETEASLASLLDEKKKLSKKHTAEAAGDKEFLAEYRAKRESLKKEYIEAQNRPIPQEIISRNETIAKEIWLSVARYDLTHRLQLIEKLMKALKKAMKLGVDLSDETQISAVFDEVVLRVRYESEDESYIYGYCVVNMTKVRYSKDWNQVRGGKIATVFQDPMTSLNPIITIGKQITSIIMKHQDCTEAQAREKALMLMKKVGIPNAEHRFDDYPFQYSGGMRQRIVIAIALSCQPKILICDEPTTALDVTIQAQILQLLKDLQKEFDYTIVFITHDLGVVANIADRVAVMYAGQIVELGNVEEVFYDPRHPYTWALMSSLPQLAQRNTELYSISGTPPSLYNKIVGDPFAPRNPYCLKIDTLMEPPMFRVTDTHFAKTWLLDPRSEKVEKPEAIQDIHGKLMKAFNIGEFRSEK